MKKAWQQLHVEYNLYDNVCIVIEGRHMLVPSLGRK